MSEKMFVIGLLVGTVSIAVLVAAASALEYSGLYYWVPLTLAMCVATTLAAISGFICGTVLEGDM